MEVVESGRNARVPISVPARLGLRRVSRGGQNRNFARRTLGSGSAPMERRAGSEYSPGPIRIGQRFADS